MVVAAWDRGRRWLVGEGAPDGLFPPLVRRVGILWVIVSVPFTTAVSAFVVDSPGTYLFVWVYMASGAYTAPALLAGLRQVRRGPAHDRPAYAMLYGALVVVFVTGVAILVGQATGWAWGNVFGYPIVVAGGLLHHAALWLLMRRRSGRLRVSIDVLEGITAVVALGAPFVVLAGPGLADAEAPWFAHPAALSVPFVVYGSYWALLLLIRLGNRRGAFELILVGLLLSGAGNAVVQTAQGISGFALPAPPLIALHAVCMSMYLLIPLHVPLLIGPGLDAVPPQSQVRGSRLAAVSMLAGLALLLAGTVAVADRQPWAVPFSLAAVSVLLVLAVVRQIAAVGENRRLYRQVEEAADERRRLVAELLERAVHERRRFAGQLYEQALAAYTSFSVMAGQSGHGDGEQGAAGRAEVSARLGSDFARTAASVRELVLAIRPLEGEPTLRERLGVPIRAYLADIYGDRNAPRLTLTVAEGLAPDWMSETLVLQIVQEALHNVCRHSRASAVEVALDADGGAVRLRVVDDGDGFDPASVPEGSGIATMRACVAVAGGTLTVGPVPGGGGVAVTARLGGGPPPDRGGPPPTFPPLRLVPPPA